MQGVGFGRGMKTRGMSHDVPADCSDQQQQLCDYQLWETTAQEL
jgi:hypothetical protein